MSEKAITVHICVSCKKTIDENETQYFFKGRYYHHDHLLNKLRYSKKFHYSPEEIKDIMKEAKRPSAREKVNQSREKKIKKVKVPSIVSKEQFKLDTKNRGKLLDYLQERYTLDTRSNGAITRMLNSVNKGTYRELNGNGIPDDTLLDMFKYYSNELDYIRVNNKKTFETTQQIFFWDLAVVSGKIADYEKMTKKVESEVSATENVVNTDVLGYLGDRVKTVNNTEDDDIDLSGFSEGYF